MNASELEMFGDRRPTTDQQPAVLAPAEGRRVIDAGAGTGKTTTLELRALYLIAQRAIRPEELLIVTFTRKAAAEIGERVIRTLDKGREGFEGDPHGVTCCTIHALAARILEEFAYACGLEAPPKPVADGAARALFDVVMDEAFAGALDAPLDALPVFEIKPAELRGAVASLVLRLKQAGIGADAFERNGLAAAAALGTQIWGATWEPGKKGRKALAPKQERTAAERALEAQREAANVRFVAAVYRRFDERLHESQAATYGDLLTQATRLIHEHAHVGETLRRRWRYVLIDEFQDTAPAQLKFLRALFGDPEHPERELTNVTAVGDFRQSIYGFNGADPTIMGALVNRAHDVYKLSENRRSREQIVAVAHAALGAGLPRDNIGTVMSAKRGRSDVACVFAGTFGGAGGPIAQRIEEEAAAIADEIAHLIGEGRPLGEIAVLLRKRTHAHRYVRALAKRGIPVALDRRSGLLEMPEIRDARAWLRLLVDFDKPVAFALALVRVLQSPQLGLDDAGLAQVAACVDRQDWAAVVLDGIADDRLDDIARTRLEQLRAWLEELIPARSESAPLGVRHLMATVPLAAAYANDSQADQRLANLRAFEVLAQAFAADAVDPRLPEFIRYCESCVDFNESIEEADLDSQGVAVMTVHQAKGLEWPGVFVPGADKLHYADRAVFSPVRFDDRHGALVISRDVDDQETLRAVMMRKHYDPATGECTSPDPVKQRRADEEARILYVALTRACDLLYVSCPTPARPHDGYTAIEALADRWPTRANTQNRALSATASLGSRVTPYEPTPLRFDFTQPPVMSFTALATYQTCPRLARYRYLLRLPQLDGAHDRLDSGSPWTDHLDPASFGSLVHRALELWGQSRIDSAPIDAAQALASTVSEYDGVGDADRARAAAMVEHATAALGEMTVLEVESFFEHSVDGTVLTGVVDLIARDGAGTVHVVDYKTGVAVGDDHYALQLDLYARAMQRRFEGCAVVPSILRLSESATEWRNPAAPPAGELERLLCEAAGFTLDEPRPGPQCASCPYQGSPCHEGAVN